MKPVKSVVIMFAAVSIGILITIGLLINLQHTARARSIENSKPAIIASTTSITPVLYLIKDISPITGSKPHYFNAIGRIVFFQADDSSHGKELWRSDGNEAGTSIVKDINPGITDSGAIYNGNWVTLNGIGIFDANDGTHGYELWRTDGTPTGTVMISDINPVGNSYPFFMTPFNNAVYFQANDGVHGYGLWRTLLQRARWNSRVRGVAQRWHTHQHLHDYRY